MTKKSPAKILKEKGLIPKHWDLRKPLTAGQKSWITKQSKTFKQLINRPGDFTIRRGNNATLSALRKAGFLTSGNKAIVPNHGAHKVSIVNGRLTFIRKHERETVILAAGHEFLDRLRRLQERRLKSNQAYAIKLGANPHSLTITQNLADIQAYISRMRVNSKSAYESMSLVLIDSFEWNFDKDKDA